MKRFATAFILSANCVSAIKTQQDQILAKVTSRSTNQIKCDDSKYYLAHFDECNECLDSIQGCIVCHRGTKCDECTQNAYLLPNRKCECEGNFNWEGNLCVQRSCDIGTYWDTTTQTCESCPDHCISCTRGNKCDVCPDNSQFHASSNSCQCSHGYILNWIEGQGETCVAEPAYTPGSVSWDSKTFECRTSFYSTSTFGGSISNNESGHFSTGGNWHDSSFHETCNLVDPSTIQCQAPQSYDAHSCRCVCPPGSPDKYSCTRSQGFNAETCSCECCPRWLSDYVCPPGTEKNIDNCSCDTTAPGPCEEPPLQCVTLNKVWDVQSCTCVCEAEPVDPSCADQGMIWNENTCVCESKCEDAKYFKTHRTECVDCAKAIPGCLVCHRGTKCDQCIENAHLTKSRECECDDGFGLEEGVCVPRDCLPGHYFDKENGCSVCPAFCDKCSRGDRCEVCPPNSKFHKSSNSCECSHGYVREGDNCVADPLFTPPTNDFDSKTFECYSSKSLYTGSISNNPSSFFSTNGDYHSSSYHHTCDLLTEPLVCAGVLEYNPNTCSCVCPVGSLTKYDCQGNRGFDAELCECTCCEAFLTTYVCPPGTIKNNAACECDPVECTEPEVGFCAASGKVWDAPSCSCACFEKLLCADNEFFDLGDCTCHSKCENKKYFKLHLDDCQSCEGEIRGCLVCHRGTKCDECTENAKLNRQRECQCEDGFDWEGDLCVPKDCPVGQFYNKTTGLCETCPSDCISCTRDGQCSECPLNSKFHKSTNSCKCSHGFTRNEDDECVPDLEYSTGTHSWSSGTFQCDNLGSSFTSIISSNPSSYFSTNGALHSSSHHGSCSGILEAPICPGNTVYDSHNCSCKCPLGSPTKFDCVGNEGFDAEHCQCTCCFAWIIGHACPTNYQKNIEACVCECDPNACGANQIQNADCSCSCDATACQAFEVQNADCTCSCPNTCDNFEVQNADCTCSCPNTCGANEIQNADCTCSCDAAACAANEIQNADCSCSCDTSLCSGNFIQNNDCTCSCPDSSLWTTQCTDLQTVDTTGCTCVNKTPKTSRIQSLGCAWCAASQTLMTVPFFDIDDWNGSSFNPKAAFTGQPVCDNKFGRTQSVLRRPCPPTTTNDPAVNFLFWQANDAADGYYFIQEQLRASECNDNSWLSYNENAPYCTTPCNPASNAECASWPTNQLGRATINQVSVIDKKAWRLNKRVGKNQFGWPCYYYTIETAATSGCMASKTYWMSFMDQQVDTEDDYQKWHLLPVTTNTFDKRMAAFLLLGLDSLRICTHSNFVF